MAEKLDEYKERFAALQGNETLSVETQSLLEEMLADLTEANRSNKALRRAIMKAGQGSAMSTRLREALLE